MIHDLIHTQKMSSDVSFSRPCVCRMYVCRMCVCRMCVCDACVCRRQEQETWRHVSSKTGTTHDRLINRLVHTYHVMYVACISIHMAACLIKGRHHTYAYMHVRDESVAERWCWWWRYFGEQAEDCLPWMPVPILTYFGVV